MRPCPSRLIFGMACIAAMAGTAIVSHANADWPQLRGPESRGIAENSNLPETWSETENIAWKTPIAGRGWSSPIVTGDRVFVTTVTRKTGSPEDAQPGLYFGGDRSDIDPIEHEWKVICLSLESGQEVWQRTLHSAIPPTSRHIKNSYASATPTTDGKRIYVLFGDVGLYCLDLDGTTVWTKEIKPRKTRNDWGPAASPVLHGERVYLVYDNNEDSFLAAYDKRTGESIWRVERDEKSNWSTPYIWENELRTEIVTLGSGKNIAYDLEGKPLYRFGGNSSITIATPYSAGGLLFVSSGYVGDVKRPIFAIKPGATGDISLGANEMSNESIVWSRKQAAPYNPTTLVYRDQLYVLKDRGIVAAYRPATGETIFDRHRLPAGKSFTASPWAYNGRVFCLNEFGDTFVLKAGREYELLAINKLDSEQLCMATPAIAGDKLILRTGDAVYCIANDSE